MNICIALDLPTFRENITLAQELKEHDIWLKVGLRSFIRDGHSLIQRLKDINGDFHIFLDLKLYDIPNTMADAAESIAQLEIDMFNVHASSGKRAMQEVMSRIRTLQKRPLVLAVTALTSFEETEFASIYTSDIASTATRFAIESFESGLDGVVCSTFESKAVKEKTDKNFITLCPGIRPIGSATDDQHRIATPQSAQENLVDFAVIGRPIYKASHPKKALEEILQSLK